MSFSLRKAGKGFLITVNIIVILVFLLSCLAPYTNPQRYWWIAVAGLGFHFLGLIVACFAVGWTLLRKKIAWLSVIALLFSFKSLSVSFAFHKSTPLPAEKKQGSIRITSWNVARFIEWKRNNNKGSRQRLKILEQIRENGGDILCLQEFFHSPDSMYYNNIEEITAMGYPYHYFSYDPDGYRQFIGSIIFSRLPIIDTGLVRYFRPSMPEALVYADIKAGEDTIRVFTTHLQSVQFRRDDYRAMHNVKKAEDSFFVNTKTVLGKVKKGLVYRSSQARIVRSILDSSPYPSVLCGDFNDIPNSYTYFTIRGDMKDAFLEKGGAGIGRTFSTLSPTLRIDYILTDPAFSVQGFERIPRQNSDHYMIRADLAYPHQ